MHNASRQLGQLITGYWLSQAIYVAAKLEIADLLAQGPRTAADLAKATSTHERSLYRMLRALASVGVFSELAPRTFAINDVADPLRRDAPGSQWAMAVMMGEEHFAAWGQLLYSIQTGQGSFRKVYGEGVFDFLSKHPGPAQVFDAAMTSIHGKETALVLDAYDFGQFPVLCDVGGGNGNTLAATLQRHPQIRGILFDLPHVVQRAQPNVEQQLGTQVANRCQFVGGDFFRQINVQADAIMMRHIIHDWDDEKCVTILKTCRAALAPGGKVLVVESVVPPGNEPGFVKWLDLTMLVIPEGKERTADEYRDLFAAAGLRLNRIVRTAGELDVLEAVPA